MSHKKEAERLLETRGLYGLPSPEVSAAAQAHATLALVEAQEAANHLHRLPQRHLPMPDRANPRREQIMNVLALTKTVIPCAYCGRITNDVQYNHRKLEWRCTVHWNTLRVTGTYQ